VKLTATLGLALLDANVRVIGPTEQPVVASLSPATATTTPGGTIHYTVTLDIPASSGGSSVSLALAPTNAGNIPASVVVPANQLSGTFDYVDASTVSSASVTATLGASTGSSTISIGALTAALMINEIDYDNVGSGDNAEFVEIYNAGTSAVNLTGYSLVLVNGSNNAVYSTIDLSSVGSLAAGQYLVVGSSSVVSALPANVLAIQVGSTGATDLIQNGSPDGAAIINTTAGTLVDALSYEGAITAAVIPGVGTVSLVEGTVLPASVADSNTVAGSLCRIPNGVDTNNASVDWKFCSTSTPGTANVP
jgi:hypothetical protein